jgi:hypothetical protein
VRGGLDAVGSTVGEPADRDDRAGALARGVIDVGRGQSRHASTVLGNHGIPAVTLSSDGTAPWDDVPRVPVRAAVGGRPSP